MPTQTLKWMGYLGGRVDFLTFSNDDTSLASATDTGHQIHIWDANTGARRRDVQAERVEGLYGVSHHPFIIASSKLASLLFNAETGHSMTIRESLVACFMPGGDRFLTGHQNDGSLTMWELRPSVGRGETELVLDGMGFFRVEFKGPEVRTFVTR